MPRYGCMLAATLLVLVNSYFTSSYSQQTMTPRTNDGDVGISSTTKQLLSTFRSELVAITPGKGIFPKSFLMGQKDGPSQEQPERRVRILHPFWIAKYEVPQNLWQAVMGSNPSRWKGPRNSVEEISFDEAQLFCRKLTALLRREGRISMDQQVDLPSEAQWEYCARSGTNSRFAHGDDIAQLDEYAWHAGNAAGNDPPVGAKKPNPWGLHDMHGYLWEWCLDPWHDNYHGAPRDESVWKSAGEPTKRVLRGGSWKDQPEKLRCASRIGRRPDTRDDAIGLRCVLTNSHFRHQQPQSNGRPR